MAAIGLGVFGLFPHAAIGWSWRGVLSGDLLPGNQPDQHCQENRPHTVDGPGVLPRGGRGRGETGRLLLD